MKINVGDKVNFDDIYAAGTKLISGGVGTVAEVKPDTYGRTKRSIAVVKRRGQKPFEIFTNGLSVVENSK